LGGEGGGEESNWCLEKQKPERKKRKRGSFGKKRDYC